MRILNSIIEQLTSQELPIQRDVIFSVQKELLQRLLYTFQDSPLYKKLKIKQDNILNFTASQLKEYLSDYPVVTYIDHIYPLEQGWSWLTNDIPDLYIKTSGTSDAKNWGKLIPSQWSSLKIIEKKAMMRTLTSYISENPDGKVFIRKAFSLTAPFDIQHNIWYISWAIRESNSFFSKFFFLPSQEVNSIVDPLEKKEQIIQELLIEQPRLWSIHGVPAWPLGIINELIARDRSIAKKILSELEYISIGWWKPDNYKNIFKDTLESLWLHQQLYWSNNHNASEWFLWAQVRNFADLNFHAMAPMHLINFFLFVPREAYYIWRDWYQNQITIDEKERAERTKNMICSSYLLHEVQSDQEYFILFANERIPWIYDIKDSIKFIQQNPWDPLEYLVTWRYKMSSNKINEHIESDHLESTIDDLIAQWYVLNKNNYIAGMEYNASLTAGLFHVIIEGESLWQKQQTLLQQKFDDILWQYNDQWKIFRSKNNRITWCKVYIRPDGFIKLKLRDLHLSHEQSKITHLSDDNYILYIKSLLW